MMPKDGISRRLGFAGRLGLAVVSLGVAVLAMAAPLRAQAPPAADDATAVSPATATPETATEPARTEVVPEETTSSTYRLQPYDLIDVEVYSEEDLHKPARLGSDGTVLLPLIGSVKVGGLTVAEATNLITQRYGAGFVKNPSVLITVLQFRRSTFSLLGAVGRPGVYDIPEGADISILEAVSMAGGYTAAAAQNSVMVKRMVDGKPTMLTVHAGDLAQNPDAEPFPILPGDTILVPSTQLHKDSFSLLGQVAKPGLYDIPDGEQITLIDALSLAGGYTPNAGLGSITVKRVVDGRTELLKVDASNMTQDPSATPFTIHPGDVIFVPFLNSSFSILGQVERPGIYQIAEGSHLNIVEAILMAGGYTRTAAQNGVLVKRMVDGKLMTIKVRAGDMAKEPDVVPFEVLPGDIINVRESWL